MGEAVGSIPTDEVGSRDWHGSDYSNTNFVMIPESQRSTQSIWSHIYPKQNWFEEMKICLERNKTGSDATEWILSNFYRWDNLSNLQACEDLSPKQIRCLTSVLQKTFLSFTADRTVLVETLNSTGVMHRQNVLSTFLLHFSKGNDKFREFLVSENLKALVEQEVFEKIRRAFLDQNSEDSASRAKKRRNKLFDPVEEVEQILVNLSLNEDARKEVLEKILLFDDLTTCLNACDELTRKQIRTLEQKLECVFYQLKTTPVPLRLNETEILKHVTKDLLLSDEAIDWLQIWMSKIKSSGPDLNEIDRCEDLTKRQISNLKERLSDFYGVDQNSGKKRKRSDPREDFLSHLSEILVSNGINDSAQKWILKEAPKFETLDSLHDCEDLTTKQARKLKEDLRELFETFKSTNCVITTSHKKFVSRTQQEATNQFLQVRTEHVKPTNSQAIISESRVFLETSCMEVDEKDSEISFTPLILFHTEMQENFLVEKFALCEAGVKYICDSVPEHLRGETPVFFKSISGTPVIDFATLDQQSFECIGLFGPLEAVFRNLQAYISESKLQVLEHELKEQKSGLYLIEVQNKRRQFLVFYSENDSDFVSVKKDSRAVHLLRYMSQLTNNVVMCLDEKYQERLSNEGETIDVKNDRRTKYNLKKHELQPETFVLKNVGVLRNNSINNSQLFCSQNSLIAAKFEKVERQEKTKPLNKTGNVTEIAELMDSMIIEDFSSISDAFKSDYTKTFFPRKFEEFESEIAQKIESIRPLEDTSTNDSVLTSVALHFVELCGSKIQFEVVKKYFTSNSSLLQNDDLGKNRINFSSRSINGPLSKEDETSLKKEIKSDENENKFALDKFLLWKALEDNGGLPEAFLEKEFSDTSWNDIRDCAIKRFNSSISRVLQSRATKNLDSQMKNCEAKLDYSNLPELAKTCIDIFIEWMCNLVQLYSEKAKFVTFCRQEVQGKLDQTKKQKLDQRIQQFFYETFLKKKVERRDTDQINLAKVRQIRDLVGYSNVSAKYQCLYEKISLEPAKTRIEIHHMTVSRAEHQRLATSDDVLDISQLDFPQIATLEFPETEELLNAFPLENNLILLVCNVEKLSKTVVHNLSNVNKPVLDMPFGKNVSSASFDYKSRVLAIQSIIDPGIVHMFKFEEGFSSRHNLRLVDLNKLFGVEKIVALCLQPNSKFFWFESDGRIRKIDYKNSAMVEAIKLDGVGKTTLKCTSEGSCVVAIKDDDDAWPVMTDTGNTLPRVEGLSRDVAIFSLCNQILAVTSLDSYLSIHQIIVTGAQHETKLSKSSLDHQKTEGLEMNTGGIKEHWINYVYWMYTKFPCNDLLASNQAVNNFWITVGKNSSDIQSKISQEIRRILRKIQKTRKPTDYLKFREKDFEESLSGITDIEVSGIPMGTFLKRLITFVPIQIARCQSNQFSILDNGQPVSLDSVNEVFDLMGKINYGFYESIFRAWPGNIKVISSMGKQTTGKSYTLNHLTGSSFNIAGTRCTDGCWMTVKEQDDCLYVILDFEGIGSFERTEQDDMLLSLFNSAISTTTIFKTDKRLDRDVDKMFNKINMGSDQLKGNEKVFKGKFMIVINDVAEQDVKDTPKEFEEKISNIVKKSEKNFIENLYNSDFEIMAFPAFESREYYESTSNLLSIVLEEIRPVFTSGPDFLETVKLLMAKLAISDFSPLDRQQIDERAQSIRSMLNFAIYLGQISDESPKKKELDLKSFDDSTFRIPLEKEIDLAGVGNVTLNDFDTVFKENQLENTVMQFLAIMEPNCENFVEWRSGLQNFLRETIIFRFERIKQWLDANFQKWTSRDNAEYDDVINIVMENLENRKTYFEQTYKFCEEKCTECFLKCTQIANHKSGHKCSTSHLCAAQCEYCEFGMNKCKIPFGHDGKHVCREMYINHVCSESCKFSELNGCDGECQKITGHEDEHACSEKRHPCKEVCTLDGCDGRCIIDCDVDHTVHKCTKEQCINKCSLPTCTNKCAALDHFHGTKSSSKFKEEQGMADEPAFLLEDGETQYDCAEHFCGKEHQCDKECEHDGNCRVWTEKQPEDETFEGERDTFTYNVKFAEMGKKEKCRQKLKPFTTRHDGGHSCSKEVHFCTTICPTCENFCNKAANHENNGDTLHHTRHGNMRKCFFVANEDEIQVGTHKYKVGEPAVAEICHVFCKSLGRGHIHIVECDSEDSTACIYSARKDQRRHESTRYHPNPEKPKDEITHKAYWASVGFEDPCQEIDAEDFQKCPAYCAAEMHEEEEEQIFCEQPLWHNPVTSMAEISRMSGFLTKDGHVLPCQHPSGIYHFVLCLDASGSMTGKPWDDVIGAVRVFVAQRLVLSSSTDRMSIVIYNSNAKIAAEYQPINSFSRNWLTFMSGGTDFSIALNTADQIIGSHLDENIKPVLIFMSDGGSSNGEVEMEQLARKYSVSNGLDVYTLGFGIIQFEKLKEMARLGRGQFLEAVDGLQLRTMFVEISAKHPANIGVSF